MACLSVATTVIVTMFHNFASQMMSLLLETDELVSLNRLLMVVCL